MNITLAYQILEVSENISKEELKKKFKRLVLKYHPDRNKEANATEKFIEIKEAYESILKSKQQSSINQDYFYQNPYQSSGTTYTTTSWTFNFS